MKTTDMGTSNESSSFHGQADKDTTFNLDLRKRNKGQLWRMGIQKHRNSVYTHQAFFKLSVSISWLCCFKLFGKKLQRFISFQVSAPFVSTCDWLAVEDFKNKGIIFPETGHIFFREATVLLKRIHYWNNLEMENKTIYFLSCSFVFCFLKLYIFKT